MTSYRRPGFLTPHVSADSFPARRQPYLYRSDASIGLKLLLFVADSVSNENVAKRARRLIGKNRPAIMQSESTSEKQKRRETQY